MSTEVIATSQLEWREVPSGSKYRRDADDPKFGWVICPDCSAPKERWRTIPKEGSEQFKNFTGLCQSCAARAHSPLAGEKPHKSGAIFYLDRADRDPNDPNNKTRFRCANYNGNNSQCLKDKSYCQIYEKDRPKWHGLCSACVNSIAGRGRKWRLRTVDITVHDWPEEDEKQRRSIAEILYSDTNATNEVVPIKFLLCGDVESWPRESLRTRLSAHMRKKERFPAACRYHRLHPIKLAQLLASKDKGQKNGSAIKMLRGPRKKLSAVERTKDVLCKLWKQSRLVGEITYEAIAAELQRSGIPEDDIGAKAVEKRFSRNGYTGKREDVVLAVLKEKGLVLIEHN